jgi:hypothetical protein
MSNSDLPDGGSMPHTLLHNKGVNIFGNRTQEHAESTLQTDIFATPGRALPEHCSGVSKESPHKTNAETANRPIKDVLNSLRAEHTASRTFKEGLTVTTQAGRSTKTLTTAILSRSHTKSEPTTEVR